MTVLTIGVGVKQECVMSPWLSVLTIGVGVKQECVMSPWLFNIFMVGRYEGNESYKWGKIGARLKLNGVDWSVAACLFADDTVLLAESERNLQRVVVRFHSVCSRRKLRVDEGKTKVMVFEKKEVEMVNFGNLYRVSVPVDGRCETVLGGERMMVVKEF